MERPLLNDKAVFPDDSVLSKYLAAAKEAYDSLVHYVEENHPSAEVVWNYYNDGKAWLAKIVKKKKTICWLSVWDKKFKVVFYFTEKHEPEIKNLNINEKLLEDFLNHKLIGKLKPFVVDVEKSEDLEPIKKLVDFKEKLK